MMENVVKGIDECYVCGRDDNGTVTFEVLCRCPNCHISNKFYKKEKLGV